MHPHGHGGDILTAAELAGLPPDGILDFSANINPLGPPPGLFDYLVEKLPEITRYPDPACRRLCAAIREHYRPRTDFIPGNGAGELIYLLLRTVAPTSVLISVPTFTLYEKAALAAGCRVFHYQTVNESGFQLDVASFCAEVRRQRPGLVILCNPNNPTGTLLNREEILAIAKEVAAGNGLLLVDEAFLEFNPGYDRQTLLSAPAPENILVLCSLTKMFAIPGLRLGFLAGPGPMLEKLRALRDPWSVNSLAQLAGEFVLADPLFPHKTAEKMEKLAGRLVAGLRRLTKLEVYPPAANYILLQSQEKPAVLVQQELLTEGILVRGCENWHGLDSRHFRVAVRTEEENKALLAALHKVIAG
ncbi:MAG: threonine-phosphate decarboxylase [Dethiobacter sp.]|nr:threonine-phosphate decarboxylase [Dethiobacter sp.]